MFTYYIVIIAAALATAALGARFAQSGKSWSRTIRVPDWTPAGRTIAIVWAILYGMSALSAIFAFSAGGGGRPDMLAALFLVHALLNVSWCFLFFIQKQIGSAALECSLVALCVVMLAISVFPLSVLGALLLVPYLAWSLYAMALTYAIFRLNV